MDPGFKLETALEPEKKMQAGDRVACEAVKRPGESMAFEGRLGPKTAREETVGSYTECQRFRQFCRTDGEGPRKVYSRLWDLCCWWLKPETRSKEQMLELVVLEQFLTLLPPEMETRVREGSPENGIQAVALAEEFLRKQDTLGKQETMPVSP